jgi:antitoxin (DNA-binding transcriptional repressor) of toxin-antitoxin stability system
LTKWTNLDYLESHMADEVTIHEAKTHLSRLVQRAHAGEDIIIRRGKVPLAMLVRYDPPAVTRSPGRLRGRIEMAPDFDELDDEMGDLFGVGR